MPDQRGLGVVPRPLSVFRVQIYNGARSPKDIRDIFEDRMEDAEKEQEEDASDVFAWVAVAPHAGFELSPGHKLWLQ